MIASNELRIGNWYNFKNPLNGTLTHTRFSIWADALDFEAYAEPIPLSAEILEKARFKDNVLLLGEKGVCSLDWHLISCTYKGETTVNLAYDYDDCAYESHNSEHRTEIKYLHQLQNLYFALTGEELPIEL